MAEKAISQLPLFPVNDSLLNSVVFPIVSNGITQKIQYNTLYNNISANVVVGKYVPVVTYNDSQTFLSNVSGNWQSTFTTVCAFSGSWGAGAGSSGLTLFKEASSAIFPNDSNNVVFALSAYSPAATNVDVAIIAKGSGATLAQIPNTNSSGGGKRGQYATDFQKARVLNTEVASGNYSVIGGGGINTASGIYTTIGGGLSNTASGGYSTVGGGSSNRATYTGTTVGGGQENTASNTHATVVGGYYNAASGGKACIGGGQSNVASGNFTTTGGGSNNTASGEYSTVGGGRENTAYSDYSTVPGGYRNYAGSQYSTAMGLWCRTAIPYEIGYSTGYHGNPYDSRSLTVLYQNTTTNPVSTVIGVIPMQNADTLFITATFACLSSPGTSTTDLGQYFGIVKAIARCDGTNVRIYNQEQVSASRSHPGTSFNGGFSGSSNSEGELRIIAFANSTRDFEWSVKIDALYNGV